MAANPQQNPVPDLPVYVPLPPVPQGRPRITTIGGHARMYSPKHVTEHKKEIRNCAERVISYMEHPCFMEGPISVVLWFRFEKPESRKRVNSTPYPFPDVKPDLDNLEKCVLDALNGVAYKDDAQITQLQSMKSYGQDASTLVVVSRPDSGALFSLDHNAIIALGALWPTIGDEFYLLDE